MACTCFVLNYRNIADFESEYKAFLSLRKFEFKKVVCKAVLILFKVQYMHVNYDS